MTAMIKELNKVIEAAYNLTTYDTEEVSIGTEALVYSEDSDFPVDGYAYATHVWEEGNCGVYHSVEWLNELVEEMMKEDCKHLINHVIELDTDRETMTTRQVDKAINNDSGVVMNNQWLRVTRYDNKNSYTAFQNCEENDIVLLTENGSVYMFLKEDTRANVEYETPAKRKEIK